MKNIQEVLREKETEIEKLTREIKLLRVAARILEDEGQPQPGRTADQSLRPMEAASGPEEPVLDLSPVAGPTNGDVGKRWP